MREMQSYPNSGSPTASLPLGFFLNETSVGANDGTKIIAEHMQDLYYFLYSILGFAGETPNGVLESNDNKQVLSALNKVSVMKYNSATSYSKGMAVFNVASDEFRFYTSLANSNVGNSLTDTTKWERVVFGNPTGSVLPYAGTTAPSGYLIADGSAISRTTYSNLFNIIGTTFGAGDGSITFNIPDFREKSPMGIKSGSSYVATLGATSGAFTHTLTVDQIPSHSHTAKQAIYYTDHSGDDTGSYVGTNVATATSSTGGGQAHPNLHPVLGVNYIIKY